MKYLNFQVSTTESTVAPVVPNGGLENGETEGFDAKGKYCFRCQKEMDGLTTYRPEEMTSKDYYFDSYAHFGIHEVCKGSIHVLSQLLKVLILIID